MIIANKVGYKELEAVLERAMLSQKSVLILGDPGIGKSSLVYQFGKRHNFELIDVRLAEYEPSDVLGIPVPDGTVTYYRPPEPLYRACQVKSLLFLDEILQADQTVLKAIFRIVLDRKLADGTPFHPETMVVAAANELTEDNWVTIPRFALLDRFVVVRLEFNADEWLEWASQNLNPVVVKFLRIHKNLIRISSGGSRVTPRRWHWVSEYLTKFGVDSIYDLLPESIYHTFVEWVKKDMKNYQAIVDEILKTGECSEWNLLGISEKNKVCELIIDKTTFSDDEIRNLEKFMYSIEPEIAAKMIIGIIHNSNLSSVVMFDLFSKLRPLIARQKIDIQKVLESIKDGSDKNQAEGEIQKIEDKQEIKSAKDDDNKKKKKRAEKSTQKEDIEI